MLDRAHTDSTTAAPAAECREIKQSVGHFCQELRAIGESCATVLSRLNEVTQAKRQTILDIAASAAERSHVPCEARPAGSLPSAVERALSSAEKASSSGAEGHIEMLELAVIQAVAMAVHNTIAANQQLDILAQAVLACAAGSLIHGDKAGSKLG